MLPWHLGEYFFKSSQRILFVGKSHRGMPGELLPSGMLDPKKPVRSARLPAAAQLQLLAFATEGDYTTPSCPSCGVKMIKRESKRGVFWGCRHYPRCRQMLGVRREAYD